jgi:hypothetical protein
MSRSSRMHSAQSGRSCLCRHVDGVRGATVRFDATRRQLAGRAAAELTGAEMLAGIVRAQRKP